MDLNRLQVELRPRNAWESLDLGFAMARHWFMPLWLLWWVTALPVSILLYLFPLAEELLLAALLLWWLKPLYEPMLLFWLSRAVFNDAPSLGTVIRQWYPITKPQLLHNLTWRRLSGNRSFYMPIALLEGLRGQQRNQRADALGHQQSAGFWLTIIGLHFEWLIFGSLLTLLYIIIPEGVAWLDLEALFLGENSLESLISYLFFMLALSLLAPFYVAAGFSLYLNRRSALEAWDIEINFRRMVARQQRKKSLGKSPLLLIPVLFLLALPPLEPAQAAELSAEQARESIEKVLSHEDFGRIQTEKQWEYIGEDDDEEDLSDDSSSNTWKDWLRALRDLFSALASVSEVLLWIGVSLLIALALYFIAKHGRWFNTASRPNRRSPQSKAPPTQLFGLDLSEESLPDDPAAEAEKLLAAGELRAAISLLYRSTLGHMVRQSYIDIPDSATENECLQHIRQHRPNEEADFFGDLTGQWLSLAYAHHHPESARIQRLCQQWRALYASPGQ